MKPTKLKTLEEQFKKVHNRYLLVCDELENMRVEMEEKEEEYEDAKSDYENSEQELADTEEELNQAFRALKTFRYSDSDEEE